MQLLRYADLKERGVVRSRMTLARWTASEGFPPGRLLSPSCRVWTEAEVAAWLASRPVARQPDHSGNSAKVDEREVA